MTKRIKSLKEWISSKLQNTNLPLIIFVSVLLFMVIAGMLVSVYSSIGPQAVHGHLSGSSIDNNHPIMLGGKWEYYENVFVWPSDFNYLGREKHGRIPKYVQVPGPLPKPYGYGTYRLKFSFISRSELFALKTVDIRSSTRIYIDGALINSIGDPSTLVKGSIPSNSSQFIVFPMDTLKKVHEIIIQISNYDYYEGGITSPLYFGTQVEVYQLSNQAKLSETISIMSILVLAIFLLILLPLHIRMDNLRFLLLFSICFVIYLLTTGEKMMLSFLYFIPYLYYTRFVLALNVLMGLFMVLYVNVQVGLDKLRWLYIFIFTGGLLVLGLLSSSQFFQGNLVIICNIFMALISVFSAGRLFTHLLKRSYSSLYQLLGFICWAGMICVSFAYGKGIISDSAKDFLSVFFAFGFVIAQILYISRHIAIIYSANERLAQRMVISDKLRVDSMEIASHELRTPLHGIINITQSVAERLEHDKESDIGKNQGDLDLVVNLARRMSGIVNDMYQFLSRTDGRTELRPTDLQFEVKAALEVFGYTSNMSKIRFINHISPEASTVYADERKLWQILNNLIGNALKYTESGTITLESRIIDKTVYISVTDTGIGMPAEDTNRIFEKSTRLSSGSDRAEGLGLGLYITRKLVEDMDGKIFVEWTVPHKGTRITFTLAECDKDAYSRMRNEESAIRSSENLSQPELMNLIWPSKARILMADDNPDNLKVIVDMFNDSNITIDTVLNGEGVLELLEKHNYDIVILDVMMPGMSGFEVCQKIRQQYSISELPVLMLTARNASNEIITGFWAGANDYVIKPVDSIELRARVFTLITLKQSVSNAIKNELDFLQAQIRPHFLYNAFNTISAIALEDGSSASELIDDLSIYLRHCFRSNSQDELVTVEDEIGLVNAYLRIEKARFGERLDIKMDLQANLHFYLPALTIQPIVENAVRHGSLNSYRTTVIKIKVFQKDDNAVIEVTDNGPGIDLNKIQSVLGGEAGDKNSGVGLLNVNRRLKLRYNRDLKIENTAHHGTRVTICIPINPDD